MDKVSVTMRVFFEDPFWIGVLERVTENGLSVCKFPFGAEPKDYEAGNRRRLKSSVSLNSNSRKRKRSTGADSPCTSLSFSESRGDKMLSEIYLNLNYC